MQNFKVKKFNFNGKGFLENVVCSNGKLSERVNEGGISDQPLFILFWSRLDRFNELFLSVWRDWWWHNVRTYLCRSGSSGSVMSVFIIFLGIDQQGVFYLDWILIMKCNVNYTTVLQLCLNMICYIRASHAPTIFICESHSHDFTLIHISAEDCTL